jgi:acyl carrier protein
MSAIRTICNILRTRFELPVQEVRLSSRFVEDLGMDVFDLPDLILSLEETFELDISLAVAARILTLKDAVKCVLSK